jgi:hypothetical protein
MLELCAGEHVRLLPCLADLKNRSGFIKHFLYLKTVGKFFTGTADWVRWAESLTLSHDSLLGLFTIAIFPKLGAILIEIAAGVTGVLHGEP